MNKKIVLLCIAIIFCFTAVGQAATLNLGRDNYQLQLTKINAQGSLGDLIVLNLGYGVDQYTGYGLEVASSGQIGIAQFEYQFIPPPKRNEQTNYNYAVKAGVVSGNYWVEEEPGGKLGLILFKQVEDKEIYFDGDLITGSTNVFDVELGIRGEISPGILGVLGYKVATSQEHGTVRGVQYGLKVNF